MVPILAHGDYVPSLPVIFVIYWLFYLAPLLVVAAPVWFFGRKRAQWNLWDFVVVLFPFLAWWYAMNVSGVQKSNQNLFVESLMIGGIASLASILRVLVAGRINQKIFALGLLVILCVLAAIWGPFLPEGWVAPFA